MVKIYVTNRNQAPKGAKLQEGPSGGIYYEAAGKRPVTTKPGHPVVATTPLPTKPEDIKHTEDLLAAAATGQVELNDNQYTQARQIYDKLAQIQDVSKYPQYQKMWDSLVQIFD